MGEQERFYLGFLLLMIRLNTHALRGTQLPLFPHHATNTRPRAHAPMCTHALGFLPHGR